MAWTTSNPSNSLNRENYKRVRSILMERSAASGFTLTQDDLERIVFEVDDPESSKLCVGDIIGAVLYWQQHQKAEA